MWQLLESVPPNVGFGLNGLFFFFGRMLYAKTRISTSATGPGRKFRVRIRTVFTKGLCKNAIFDLIENFGFGSDDVFLPNGLCENTIFDLGHWAW